MFKVTPKQIALAGIMVSIGIVAEVFIRIGEVTFLNISIYMAIGIVLNIFLGIISVIVIDTMQMIFRGRIGEWYWSFQIEAILLVITAFIIKQLLTKIKNRNHIFYTSISLLSILIITFTTVFIIQSSELSFEHKYIRGHLETDEQLATRLTQKIFSVVGIIILCLYMSFKIYKFKTKEMEKNPLVMITIILTIIIIDWFYHPWAVNEWRSTVLGINWSYEVFNLSIIKGIWMSAFHMALNIPIVYAFIFVNENFKEQNTY